MTRAATAEALGTFVLVLATISVAVAASLPRSVAGPAYGSLAVPTAVGLALVILVAGPGHISHAHLSPAVTLGPAAGCRLPWVSVPGSVVAKLARALAAAGVTWGLYGDRPRTPSTLDPAGYLPWRLGVPRT